jgi:outer membrane protein assembly factor BamA
MKGGLVTMITTTSAIRPLLQLILSFLTQVSIADPQTVAQTDKTLDTTVAVIGNVTIQTNNVFDTTNPEENKSLYRFVNRLHIVTRQSVVRSQLQLRPGDNFSVQKLRESERLLRQNRFLYDANIVPTLIQPGVVDLTVTTRDNWTLLPTFSVSSSGGENRHRYGIKEQNLFGTGSEINVEQVVNDDRDSTIFEFSDRNLGRSWLSLDVFYRNSSDGDAQRMRLTRPFYALTARWAAGIDLGSNDRVESLYSIGEIVAKYRHEEELATAWFGWSSGLVDNWSRRWSVGYKFDESRFETETDPEFPSLDLRDRSLHYPLLRYEAIEDQFQITRNLDTIGQTEDVYLGTRYSATIGFLSSSLGADHSGLLFDGSLQKSIGSPAQRLLVFSANAAGRYESGNFQNTLVEVRAEHYVRQTENRVFYASLRSAVGKQLDIDNPITLGGKSGLRGYPRSYGNGDMLALLTLEQRYYTNWYPFRLFRVGGAVFADVGRTWGNDVTGRSDHRVHANLGVGLRLAATRGNSNKVLHIDLAVPLRNDASIDGIQIIIEAKRGF